MTLHSTGLKRSPVAYILDILNVGTGAYFPHSVLLGYITPPKNIAS